MLSFYLFYRFQKQGETFPGFTTSRDWFDLKLFKVSKAKEMMVYKTQSTAIKRGLNACNIKSTKDTHIFHGPEARIAEIFGVDESQIRRNGQWNTSSMNKAYLTGLPRNLMRQLAGFPKDKGYFYLQRAVVTPPDELRRLVFPDIDLWLDRINASTAQDTATANEFLSLLKSLRVIYFSKNLSSCENYFPTAICGTAFYLIIFPCQSRATYSYPCLLAPLCRPHGLFINMF